MSTDATRLLDDLAVCYQIVRQLQQRVQDLEREVAELKARLHQNSSKPPSSDPPSVSEAGSRFVERTLSVVATCRQQNRNALELLTACCVARLDGSVRPSLLPAESELAAA